MATEVLLVEDNPADVRLYRESFVAVGSSARLHVTSDGIEAMQFLKREGIYATAPRPDLILLDLNLLRMDGRAVLAHIKDDSSLRLIPTVILTTSDADTDIRECYRRQANCYLCKPQHLDEFESLVKGINDFWLTKVRYPAC